MGTPKNGQTININNLLKHVLCESPLKKAILGEILSHVDNNSNNEGKFPYKAL